MHPKIFIHENIEFTEETLYKVTRKSFKHYPFIYLSIDSSKIQVLHSVLKRGVCIARFAEIFVEGASLDDINKQLPGQAYEFTPEKTINDTACSDEIYQILKREVLSTKSFSFTVHGQYKKISRKTKIEHIEALDLPQIKGKCDLSKPERVFILNELYIYETQKLVKVYWGKDLFAMKKKQPFNSLYALTNRVMLGPTSTEHNLAFLMANMGQAEEDKLLVDPFLGTGSILVACSYFKAVCFGSEIGRIYFFKFILCFFLFK
jgi:tRNA (guanine10-N2)-methyltransferase